MSAELFLGPEELQCLRESVEATKARYTEEDFNRFGDPADVNATNELLDTVTGGTYGIEDLRRFLNGKLRETSATYKELADTESAEYFRDLYALLLGVDQPQGLSPRLCLESFLSYWDMEIPWLPEGVILGGQHRLAELVRSIEDGRQTHVEKLLEQARSAGYVQAVEGPSAGHPAMSLAAVVFGYGPKEFRLVKADQVAAWSIDGCMHPGAVWVRNWVFSRRGKIGRNFLECPGCRQRWWRQRSGGAGLRKRWAFSDAVMEAHYSRTGGVRIRRRYQRPRVELSG